MENDFEETDSNKIDNNKLNWKDKNILERLDVDSRSSNSEIGRSVGLSSQIVNYRIAKLEERGVIKGFYSVINIKKLGYTHYKVLFKTRYLNSKAKDKILMKVKEIPDITWFVGCRGDYNLIASIMTKDVEDFSFVLEKLLDIIGRYLVSYVLFIVIRLNILPYRKLLGKDQAFEDEKSVGYKNAKIDIDINETDRIVLKSLSINSRIGKKELSSKTNISVDKISYSIEKLEKNGVIKAYKPLIDITKVGMAWHSVFIRFKPGGRERKDELVDYLKGRYSAFYILQGVGSWNLMVEFHSFDLNDFNSLYDKMLLRFEDIIGEVSVTQILNEYVNRYLPEGF